MRYYLDMASVKAGHMDLAGWAAPDREGTKLSYDVLGPDGQSRSPEVIVTTRPDLGYTLFRDPDRPDLGFYLRFPYAPHETVTLRITERQGDTEVGRLEKKVSDLGLSFRKAGKAVKGLFRKPVSFGKKVIDKLTHADEKRYRAWFLAHRADAETLQKQREAVFPYAPLISVLVPLYRTPVRYFREMADSVLGQTYKNLELVLANASPEDAELAEAVRAYAAKDPRVVVADLPLNLGISDNTNAAARAARGEYVALMDHDDLLEPDALYEYVSALNEKGGTASGRAAGTAEGQGTAEAAREEGQEAAADIPDIALLYCDEDKITEDSEAYFYPNFKPDFAPAFLTVNNYVCHLSVVKKAVFDALGGLRKAFDGAQDHDLVLRIADAGGKVVHVPRVLYHWRSTQASTASGAGAKSYAVDAGRRAVDEHFKRAGLPAHAEQGPVEGCFFTSRYTLPEKPRVSVIIPNKDHISDLETCLKSLYERSTYGNLEVIVVENNSVEPATFRFYEDAEARYPGLKVLRYEGPFNFSAINNMGAAAASGEYLLLLNNDVEAESPDFLERMMAYAMQEDVGAVGARLLYPDRTVQHAGILVGFRGVAGHLFAGLPENKPGYMGRAVATQEVSAVTAACLLVRRGVYTEAGGMDEALQVAFNDVDFCLKVREKGYRNIYVAEAVLIHAESKSRGVEDTPEKFRRFAQEAARVSTRWHILKNGPERFEDPYYNPNLSYLECFGLGD
ncbi:MAG: glycosyltransferase family 2 protein [Lachnospiraceae bacterium]|nr:glycosyltransferase family 2 protein [Lachnospiraceae bacterium]